MTKTNQQPTEPTMKERIESFLAGRNITKLSDIQKPEGTAINYFVESLKYFISSEIGRGIHEATPPTPDRSLLERQLRDGYFLQSKDYEIHYNERKDEFVFLNFKKNQEKRISFPTFPELTNYLEKLLTEEKG